MSQIPSCCHWNLFGYWSYRSRKNILLLIQSFKLTATILTEKPNNITGIKYYMSKAACVMPAQLRLQRVIFSELRLFITSRVDMNLSIILFPGLSYEFFHLWWSGGGAGCRDGRSVHRSCCFTRFLSSAQRKPSHGVCCASRPLSSPRLVLMIARVGPFGMFWPCSLCAHSMGLLRRASVKRSSSVLYF